MVVQLVTPSGSSLTQRCHGNHPRPAHTPPHVYGRVPLMHAPLRPVVLPSSFSVTTQACFHGCPRLLTGSGFNMGLLPSGRLAPPIYSRKSSQVPLCLPLPLATFFLWPHIRDTREAGGGGHAGLGHRTGVLGSLQKRNRAQALRANSDS